PRATEAANPASPPPRPAAPAPTAPKHEATTAVQQSTASTQPLVPTPPAPAPEPQPMAAAVAEPRVTHEASPSTAPATSTTPLTQVAVQPHLQNAGGTFDQSNHTGGESSREHSAKRPSTSAEVVE